MLVPGTPACASGSGDGTAPYSPQALVEDFGQSTDHMAGTVLGASRLHLGLILQARLLAQIGGLICPGSVT
jgi:hypothetical protein